MRRREEERGGKGEKRKEEKGRGVKERKGGQRRR